MHNGKYLPLVGIFLFFIVLLIAGALSVRAFNVLQMSKFDGRHQFLIGFVANSENPSVLALAPDTASMTLITLHQGSDVLDEIPLDVKIANTLPATAEIPDFFRSHTFNGLPGLTWFDELQLWWFTNNIRPKNITTIVYTLPSDQNDLSQNLPTLLRDSTLYAQAASIAIVNASDTSGVGSDLAKKLTTIGGNVISVTTADNPQNETTITYIGAYSYSVRRIEQIMRTKAIPDTKHTGIADITITLGTK